MNDEPFPTPIDGILDLHTFAPADVKSLIGEYIDACQERGILQLRLIHGKGTGTLRRIAQTALERHPAVIGYRPADAAGGSWGATLVDLRPRQKEE